MDYLRLVSVVYESDDKYHDAKDPFRSDAVSQEPARMRLFALRRLSGYLGYFANLEHAIWVANSPWMVWFLFGTLTMTFAQALTLDFETLAMVSRCGSLAFDADIVDELLLCAASVHPIFGLPQCISAHNCDTKTMLRLLAFLPDLYWAMTFSVFCGTPFSLIFAGYKTLLELLMIKTYLILLCWLTQIQRTPSRGSVNGLFCVRLIQGLLGAGGALVFLLVPCLSLTPFVHR